jgi:LacI family transcriptional regulator
MTKRRITIKDVAARAGVSIATVSNVFSGRKPVNEELKLRVNAAAKALSYQVDRAASQLRTGQTRVVGVLVPDLDDVFFTSLVSQIEVLARKDNYEIIIASSRDDAALERSRLDALLSWRPAGLIAVPCTDRLPKALQQEAGRLPMVLADRVPPGGSIVDTVAMDNREAGEIAARYLATLGHDRILIAASSLSISPIRERVEGVARLARQRTGGEPTVVELGSNAESGAQGFMRWLERNDRPSAVIALTNVTTLSVLSALARLKIDIPDPVSVIGFDDYPWMSARKTGLTAIRQPIEEIAAAAWDQLRKRMAGDASPPRALVLSGSLRVRDSVLNLSRADAPATEAIIETQEEPRAIH